MKGSCRSMSKTKTETQDPAPTPAYPALPATLPAPHEFFLGAEHPSVWKTYRLHTFTWWLMKTRNTVIERCSLNILNL